MMENRPGGIGFTRGFSLERELTVGEQITAKQLLEKRIIITLSRHDHVYRHHVHNK